MAPKVSCRILICNIGPCSLLAVHPEMSVFRRTAYTLGKRCGGALQ